MRWYPPARLLRFLCGLLLVGLALGQTLGYLALPGWQRLETLFYDTRLQLTAPGGVDQRLVIVDIDERSLAELGRWPWGRDRMAALLEQLYQRYQVRLVGFDVLFPEADASSGLPVLDQLLASSLMQQPGLRAAIEKLRPQLDHDQRFAAVLQHFPAVLGLYFSDDERGVTSGALPPPPLPLAALPPATEITNWPGYAANLPRLQTAAGWAGHVNVLADEDGLIRRAPLLVAYAGHSYEALSLAMFRRLLGGVAVQPGVVEQSAYAALEWLQLPLPQGGIARLPVNQNVAALIPYRGAAGSFAYVSAADILAGRLPAEALAGRVALVGTTAPGLEDLRNTPVGIAYPGVEIHANLLAAMLDGTLPVEPPFALGAEVLTLLLVALVGLFWLPRLSPVRAALLYFGLLALLLGSNFWLWQSRLLALPLANPLLLLTLFFLLHNGWGYFVETRGRQRFTALFGQYVPPPLVAQMAADPDRYDMAGRTAELTVLFADVRDFTRLAEQLPAADLAAWLNAYLGSMTTVVRDQLGTLDKYIGDALMAFWGAPIATPDHARQAVLAALAMQEALPALNADFAARGWPPVRIGIGLNTGPMVVGDLGSPLRKAYTVVGDAVNLAARLEGLAPRYGVGVVVGEATQAAVASLPGSAECLGWRELDRVRVKGREQALTIYEPLRPATLPAAELAAWQDFLTAYRAADWPNAELRLVALRQAAPQCYLYVLYAERLAELSRNQPAYAPWDGVTVYDSK